MAYMEAKGGRRQRQMTCPWSNFGSDRTGAEARGFGRVFSSREPAAALLEILWISHGQGMGRPVCSASKAAASASISDSIVKVLALAAISAQERGEERQ